MFSSIVPDCIHADWETYAAEPHTLTCKIIQCIFKNCYKTKD
jgi:hypothetical protein